jgi:hypothetical protein
MKELKPQIADKGIFYVSVTGGVPAMNTALQFIVIKRIPKDQLRLRSVDRPRNAGDGSKVMPIDINQTIGKYIMSSELESLINQRNYYLALKILEENRNFFELYDKIYQLIYYAYLRNSFAFSEASEVLEKIDIPQKEKGCPPKDSDKPAQISELLSSIIFNLSSGEMLDFLARNYAFGEIVVDYFLEKIFGSSYGDYNSRATLFSGYYSKNPDLLETLEGKFTQPGKEFDPTKSSFPVKVEIFKYIISTSPDDMTDKSISKDSAVLIEKFLSMVEHINELRHKTIIAHRLGGVTEKDLISASRCSSIDEISSLYEEVGYILQFNPKDPFDSINQVIIGYIA